MVDAFKPIGVSGLRKQGGIVSDEWLRELQGERGRKTLREMADSDAIIGGILFATTNLLAQMGWRVEPEGEQPTPADIEVAEFIDGALHDMSNSWQDTLTEILTLLPFGWSYMEVIYKRRQGWETEEGASRHDDGKIGWRGWRLRAQESLERWEFDDTGGIQGMVQRQEQGPPVLIPIDRALLFRTTATKGNPEGRSILRNAYRSWYEKKHIETIEGIGIERDLAGLPVAYVPAEILSPSATADQQAVLAAIKEIVTSIRRDEQEGIVWPLAYDDNGKQTYDLKLLSTGGTRQFDTDKIINRKNAAMAMSCLADFILLGHEKVGSFALADSKTSLFGYALGSFADRICDVVNTHAIPRLLRLNGMKPEAMPVLRHGDVETANLAELADFLDKLAGKGLLTPDRSLEAFLREVASLPVQDEDEEDMVDVPAEEPVVPVEDVTEPDPAAEDVEPPAHEE